MNFSMRWSLPLLLALLCFSFTAALRAETYKWTDDGGTVVYSQDPPPAGHDAKIIPDPPPLPEGSVYKPSEPPVEAVDEPAQEDPEIEAKRKRIMKANCEASKKNLEMYKAAHRILEPSGEVITLDDELRAEKIRMVEGQIKEFCK